MINIIDLVLSLLTTVIGNIKGSAGADANAIAEGIEAAITALQAVQNTPVTYSQLESLRVKPTF